MRDLLLTNVDAGGRLRNAGAFSIYRALLWFAAAFPIALLLSSLSHAPGSGSITGHLGSWAVAYAVVFGLWRLRTRWW